jgi:tRNA(Arg) A34 adenosine deaminase TadA
MDSTDQRLLREAFRLARESRERGDLPFGALLAGPDGVVLAEAQSTVLERQDVTGHAEMNLLKTLGVPPVCPILRQCTLYASAEPCVMCAGAIFWAGVGRVVFGLGIARLHEVMGKGGGELRLTLPCRAILSTGRPIVEVVGPIFQTEAAEIHRGFWQEPTALPRGAAAAR